MNAIMKTVNPFDENLYILWDEDSKDAIIIDPGMMRDAERDMITNFIEDNGLHVTHILLTHLHIDHVASARWMADKYGVDLCASLLDAKLGEEMPEQVRRFNLNIDDPPVTIDRSLDEGDKIALGEEEIEVLHIPGHSPGGLAFYLPQSNLLFAGDSIFNGSIGRTDLYGGSMTTLVNAIHEKILTLPDETIIASGHGPTTTVADEKRYNPFL